jgi:hypothetical protein
MSKTFFEYGRKTLGYTIDQTILVVAVIAILITLIIASVGWDLITRAGGTKLASYLTQIEQANGTFFGRHRMWPDTALDAGGVAVSNIDDNIRVLQENIFAAGNRWDQNHQNLLPGFSNDGVNLLSGYGDGIADTITQDRVDLTAASPSADQVSGISWVITLNNVPIEEAQRADIGIDGAEDFANGRVTVMQDGSPCDNLGVPAVVGVDATTTVCYIANAIN